MTYALFVGCKIPARVPLYEVTSRAVLERLGVSLVDLDFTCCGYPSRHQGLDAFLVLAARNLALAAREGLDILALCQCCYGSLRHAQHMLREDEVLRAAVDRALAPEGLSSPMKPAVRHLLKVLDEDVGVDTIRAAVRYPQSGLRVAPHYGCHALRPSDVVDLDNSQAPTIFERLVEATGATAVDCPRRLDCCGAPLAETNTPLANRIRATKIADAKEAGAETFCTACPYCETQFTPHGAEQGMETLVYSRLLARALGLDIDARDHR
jgi:heterodisulfide reductase subunit B2